MLLWPVSRSGPGRSGDAKTAFWCRSTGSSASLLPAVGNLDQPALDPAGPAVGVGAGPNAAQPQLIFKRGPVDPRTGGTARQRPPLHLWCLRDASHVMPEVELRAFRPCEVIGCTFCQIAPLSTPDHGVRLKCLNVGFRHRRSRSLPGLRHHVRVCRIVEDLGEARQIPGADGGVGRGGRKPGSHAKPHPTRVTSDSTACRPTSPERPALRRNPGRGVACQQAHRRAGHPHGQVRSPAVKPFGGTHACCTLIRKPAPE